MTSQNHVIPCCLHLKNRAKSLHCIDQSHIPSPHCTPSPIQCTEVVTNMFRSSSANPAKLKKLTKILIRTPQIQLRDAMMLAKYSVEEISDKAFRCFLQRALPGSSLTGLKAQTAGAVPPPLDCTERYRHCTNIERTPSDECTTPPTTPLLLITMRLCSLAQLRRLIHLQTTFAMLVKC